MINDENVETIKSIGEKISKGARAFLYQEYLIMSIFIGLFSLVVLVVVDIFGHHTPRFSLYSTVAFIVGSVTSILCGFIGMSIAVSANFRTTFKATLVN